MLPFLVTANTMDNAEVFLAFVLVASPALAVYQDLTWVLDMNHISYMPSPNGNPYPFKYELVRAGPYAGNHTFVAVNAYSTLEHVGTHIDAPYHFSRDGLHMDEVPLKDLIGPLVKIDITERAKQNPDALLTLKDLQDWEKRNGRIPDGSFIIMSSGWDQYYGDTVKYVGTDQAGVPVHFPSLGGEAVRWLLDNRNIKGMGVDTMSCDSGNAVPPVVHATLLPAQKVCFENLRSVGKVPECGAKIFGLPTVMKNSTGAQGRVFAEWFPGIGYMTDCNGALKKGSAEYMTSVGNAFVGSTILLARIFATLVL